MESGLPCLRSRNGAAHGLLGGRGFSQSCHVTTSTLVHSTGSHGEKGHSLPSPSVTSLATWSPSVILFTSFLLAHSPLDYLHAHTMENELDTSKVGQWRPIVTLIIFVVTSELISPIKTVSR